MRWPRRRLPVPPVPEPLVDPLALFADDLGVHDPDVYAQRLAEAGWPTPTSGMPDDTERTET